MNEDPVVRAAKVMLFTLGTMHGLKEKGLLLTTPRELTPKGLAEFDQLVASGWRPAPGEVNDCTAFLIRDAARG